MKKVSTIIVTLLLLITLISCNKTKLYASVNKITVTSKDLTSVTLDVDLDDPDEQLEGNLVVSIVLDKKVIQKKEIALTTTKDELKDIRFTGLTSNTTYSINFAGTYNGSPVTLKLLNNKVSTQIDDEKIIDSEQDFLDIFNSSIKDEYTKYTLSRDLDFSSEELTEAISKRNKTTFNSEFDGAGYTIKNYTTTRNQRYMGLFNRLLKGANIYNLTIDNMIMDIESDITYDRDIGLLFGRSSSKDAIVNDITITNSEIRTSVKSEGEETKDIAINTSSTSGKVNIGLFGGNAMGTIENIKVDDNTKMNLAIDKYASLTIGGFVGLALEDVNINNINNGGTINLDINQSGKSINYETADKLTYNNHFMYVGGLIGNNKSKNISTSLTKTTINLNENILMVNPETKETKYEISVGGIFGMSGYAIDNTVYQGNIDVNLGQYELAEAKENATIYETEVKRVVNVGGIGGKFTNPRFTAYNKAVRSNSNITITTKPETDELVVRSHTLFGTLKPNSNFTSSLDKFRVHGTIIDSSLVENSNITEVVELKDFLNNEWLLEQIK